MHRRRPAAVCAAGAIVISLAAPAMANDAQLRAKINELRPTFDADGRAFSMAISGPANQDTINRSIAAAGKLIQDADAARTALRAIPASSPRVAKGRKLLITSLGQLSAGLKRLRAGLMSPDKSTAQREIKSAGTLLGKSDRSERRGERLIGAKISS